MHTAGALAAASQAGITPTLREPERDIDAQIRALMDDSHPKVAVFLARTNGLGNRELPRWVFVETRDEGILLTTSAIIAAHFRLLDEITDAHVAAMLGYPETKADVLNSGDGVVVQALDSDGAVVFEAAASHAKMHLTMSAAAAQVPTGGRVNVTSPLLALSRRISGMH